MQPRGVVATEASRTGSRNDLIGAGSFNAPRIQGTTGSSSNSNSMYNYNLFISILNRYLHLCERRLRTSKEICLISTLESDSSSLEVSESDSSSAVSMDSSPSSDSEEDISCVYSCGERLGMELLDESVTRAIASSGDFCPEATRLATSLVTPGTLGEGMGRDLGASNVMGGGPCGAGDAPR